MYRCIAAMLLVFLPIVSRAQFALESAETLLELLSVNEEGAKPVAELTLDETAAAILVAFDDSLSALPARSVTYVDIFARYDRNPFVNDRPSARIRLVKGQRGIEGLAVKSPAPLLGGGMLGMSVTGLADGLAKFLVKRTKQELNEMFFRQLHRALGDHAEFGAIFPDTRHALTTIGGQISQLDGYIGMLREAARSDFRKLPGRLSGVLANRDWIADSTARTVAVGMFASAQLLVEGRPLPELIDRLADGRLVQDPELSGAFRTLRSFSEGFRSSTAPEGSHWLPFDRVRAMLDEGDNRGYQLFLGLLYQRYAETPVGGGRTFGQLLSDKQADLTALKGLLLRLAELSDRAQGQTAARRELLRKAAPEEADLSSESTALETCLDVLAVSEDLHGLLRAGKAPGTADKSLLQKAVATLRLAASLETQVRQKRYASSVVTVLDVARLWLKNTAAQQPILRLGSFLAALADAESSDQVAAAIEAFALPPGSATLKKQTAFSIGLNSYVGAYYGQEFVPGSAPQNGALGLNSPVGLSFNWGWQWGKTRSDKPICASVSALFSAIDIGAVTAYRFRDSTAQELPAIKLGDILSPGAFLVLGLPGAPISLGGGLQYCPTLKSVGQAPGAGNLLRWSAFIGVDIPIFHLYNRQRKK